MEMSISDADVIGGKGNGTGTAAGGTTENSEFNVDERLIAIRILHQ